MAGPGRPATGPGRTRGRLPANWTHGLALQQNQTQAEPIKVPKKRGPKPGSKVATAHHIIRHVCHILLWYLIPINWTGGHLKRISLCGNVSCCTV